MQRQSFPGSAQYNWTAVKVTQHGHGEPDRPYVLDEELEPGDSDSGRYLRAGARRAFWLRTPPGCLGDAIPALRGILAAGAHTLVESNSILEFFDPDLYLVVLDFACKDFKPSTLRYLDRADALVVIDRRQRDSARPVGREKAVSGAPAGLCDGRPCRVLVRAAFDYRVTRGLHQDPPGLGNLLLDPFHLLPALRIVVGKNQGKVKSAGFDGAERLPQAVDEVGQRFGGFVLRNGSRHSGIGNDEWRHFGSVPGL